MATHLFSARRMLVAVVASVALVASACKKDSTTAPATASALQATGGDKQVGIVGQPLQSPLIVQINDANGHPLSGISVSWTVASGGGSLSSATSVTDENGYAEVGWTLGTISGAGTVTATANSTLTATFSSTASPGSVAALVKIGGDGQTVAAGAVTSPFSIRAVDVYGNAVSGVPITWVDANGGVMSANAEVTDANGLAQITLQTDATTETYVISAIANNIAPVTFTATSTAADSTGTTGN